ncbi:hypothetical protein D1AOALGA4SA_7136 [Olavius algarvensis Delta 1 endosymbiont]|nr:hypothetical protein D1AOALGA4SA_7136 [Olavius algarvensis Delta 1 endosymbiont]
MRDKLRVRVQRHQNQRNYFKIEITCLSLILCRPIRNNITI